MLYNGIGSIFYISKILKENRVKKILLVSGKESFSLCGAEKKIRNLKKNYEFLTINDFEVNPKIQDIKKALDFIEDNQIDLILSIGGGSVLDMSKLIKACYGRKDKLEEIVKGKERIKNCDIPIIAVPTTSGSGSEATHFAVAYIGKKKYSVASNFLLPDYICLDSSLSISSSPYQKSCNVLDAISQAIESSWAVSSNDESRELSFESLNLSMKNYKKFIFSKKASKSSQSMMEASHLAGKAINIAKTTSAHAWSYGFSSYFDIPHGHAVWLTLPKIYEIHSKNKDRFFNDSRGKQHLSEIMNKLNKILGINSNDEIESFFKQFLTSIGIEGDFRKLINLSRSQKKLLLNSVNEERMMNNPIKFTDKDKKDIFYF